MNGKIERVVTVTPVNIGTGPKMNIATNIEVEKLGFTAKLHPAGVELDGPGENDHVFIPFTNISWVRFLEDKRDIKASKGAEIRK